MNRAASNVVRRSAMGRPVRAVDLGMYASMSCHCSSVSIASPPALGRLDARHEFSDRTYNTKLGAGYSFDQIAAKRKSLEGVLVPLTAVGNVSMLEAEGWKVSQFWQHLNFAGWLAVKPKAGV